MAEAMSIVTSGKSIAPHIERLKIAIKQSKAAATTSPTDCANQSGSRKRIRTASLDYGSPVKPDFLAQAASASKPPMLVSTPSNVFLDVVMEDPDEERDDAVENVSFNFLPG